MNNKKVLSLVAIIAIIAAGVWLITNSLSKSPPTGGSPEGSTGEPQTQDTKTPASYTLAEVSEHDSEKDCWMAIEGKVYDVTHFIPQHPGGKAIIGGCGKDATVLFNERPTNNKGPHPAQAKSLLPQFYIGDLKR